MVHFFRSFGNARQCAQALNAMFKNYDRVALLQLSRSSKFIGDERTFAANFLTKTKHIFAANRPPEPNAFSGEMLFHAIIKIIYTAILRHSTQKFLSAQQSRTHGVIAAVLRFCKVKIKMHAPLFKQNRKFLAQVLACRNSTCH